MSISEKESKRKQHEKELKSFRNKMGQNIVWFDSLSLTKQYDLLFQWKRERHNNKLTNPKKLKLNNHKLTVKTGGEYSNG